MSKVRQPKQIFGVRLDPYDADIVREQRRMMLRDFFDPHKEPEVKLTSHSDEELFERVVQLEEEVTKLKHISKELGESKRLRQKAVVIREISHDEAKKSVERYMQEHGTADTEELLLNLRIGLRTLVEIIDELKTEGKIRAAESN